MGGSEVLQICRPARLASLRKSDYACMDDGDAWFDMQSNYGKDDETAVQAIKGLYKELQLEEAFREYEHDSYQKLCSEISKQDQLPEGVFKLLLNKIYKRSK